MEPDHGGSQRQDRIGGTKKSLGVFEEERNRLDVGIWDENCGHGISEKHGFRRSGDQFRSYCPE